MSLAIELLSARPQHVDTLARWHYREWGDLMADWSAADAQQELADHAGRETLPTTLVATRGEELLGSVSLLAVDAVQFDDLGPWLGSLYVRPDARGVGLGRHLVEAAVALAARHGVDRLFLFTIAHRPWYESLGWEWQEDRQLFGYTVAIMAISPVEPLLH